MSGTAAALLVAAVSMAPVAQRPMPAAAQRPGATVAGVVRNSDDGQPIAYAHIRVLDDSVSDWSDAAGRYRLEGLEPGRWRVRVTHPGYDSLDLEILVPGNRALRLDIALEALPGPAPAPLADFQPFEIEYTLPTLLNTEEVKGLIQASYPRALATRRVGGETVLRLWLDEQGRVVRSALSASCGHPALDSLALDVSGRMRFQPARNRDQAVRVIVRIPVIFTVPEVAPSLAPH